MLSNYFKLAFRNLKKNALFSLLNIAGLAVGMACCLLIVLYVRREKSMDAFHSNAERMYKVLLDVKMNDDVLKIASVPPAVAPAMASEAAGVEAFARVYNTGSITLRNAANRLFYEKGIFADTAFLRMFSFALESGEGIGSALSDPGKVVISQRLAEKFFPGQNPLGQTITIDNRRPFTVSAVMRDVPDNSTLQFDFILPWTAVDLLQSDVGDDNWTWAGASAFVLLHDSGQKATVESQLPALLQKHLDEKRAARFSLSLQPMRDIYFGSSDYQNVSADSLGDARYLQFFSWLALMVLAIACINFMNLATARATMRAREVGMRKSLGATKGQLVGQFLSEGMLMSMLAFALALGLSVVAAPYSEAIFGVPLRLDFVRDQSLAYIYLAIALGTGLAAGFYPAFVLSAFQPMQVLRNQIFSRKTGAWLRKGLVVAQFTATVGLLAASTVIYRQMQFMVEKDPGFRKEQMAVLPLNGVVSGQKVAQLRRLLEQTPGVTEVSFCSNTFDGSGSSNTIKPEGSGENGGRQVVYYAIDDQWLKATGVKLLAGRFFSPEYNVADTARKHRSILVNETAAREFGWGHAEQAIGKHILAGNDSSEVVGVVSDFNFTSLHTAIEPIMLIKSNDELANALIRFEGATSGQIVSRLQDCWQQALPELPFDYFFLDEHLAELYETEKRASRLSAVGTGLAILVACLGLFGLALFSTQRRSKEIGIRKVLGASVAGIVQLLARDFLFLVLLAIVLATPLAYYFMRQWLQDFAFRIELKAWIFAFAGLLAVLIAFLTVSLQSIQAALTNPVESLRSE